MCRSRSGRQVRTATVEWRAVARQSMERVSSPGTYSRRLSNSVPSPRVRTLVRPSSSRSRDSLEGRCLRLVNGEGADGPGDPVGALAGEEAQGAVGPDRDAVRVAVAATGGAQAGGHAAAFPRGHRQIVAGGCGLGARLPAAGWPGVAQAGPERAARRIADRQGDVGGLAQAGGGVAGAGEAEAPYGGGQGEVAGAGDGQRGVDREDARPARVPDADGDGGQGRDERGASGESHQRGTGTWARIALMTESAVTPSISASGRSCTRCRRVGRARAFTSSGVT